MDHRAIGASPRLSMPNAQTIHVKYCTSTSTACESKHEDHRAIGASHRLSTPNAVQLQVQRKSISTAIAWSVHHPGCPRQMRYNYKYSVRVQLQRSRDRCVTPTVHAKCSGYPCQILYECNYGVRVQTRGPSRDRCTPTAVYTKRGTVTSTACELTHASTIGTSPWLSIPQTCTCTSTTCELKHAPAVHAKTLCKWYKKSTYVQAQALMYTTHAAQAAHAMYCTTHAYTYSRRVVQRSGCTGRLPYIYTYTYKIHCSGCPSRTLYHTYTRGKCSAQAPV